MKLARALATLCLVGALAYALAYWWYGTLVSEWIWTSIANQLDHGKDPGLVSDVEFVVVAVCSLVVATTLVLSALKLCRVALRRRARLA
jgi:hypothetical protein